ncbi:hypothetical protein PGT21_034880 [Puccinia graminis f. sp. tritici]|uniref:Uncharacterized protein n=1 Tax=Puccinia graminis f. sp. tritici TaxID=56615 RepID=A0A5B0NID1_PUCGR|nr:hypothetical protein PGT21_034880 [Puccinia graminis f. sp. tritici]
MDSTVPCLAYPPILTGRPIFSFNVTVRLETETVSVLKRRVREEVERRNATLLGMYAGDKRLDSTENECSMLLKDIVEFHKHGNIRCKVAMKSSQAGIGGLLGAAASPSLTIASLAAAGFSAAGIVARTPASAFMATYKGSVPARSAIAVGQSIGAAGLGVAGIAVVTGVGGFVAYHTTRALINLARGDSNKEETSQQA